MTMTCYAADIVPLKRGVYVEKRFGCIDPPTAAILTFAGHAFGDAQMHDCHSVLLNKTGTTYTIRTSCTNSGEGNAHANCHLPDDSDQPAQWNVGIAQAIKSGC